MSRSVSVPRNATSVAYVALDEVTDDASFEWESFLEDLVENVLQPRYSSLSKCDRWIGREDLAILENRHAYFGVSEYCGLVAVWILPKDSDTPELSVNWCDQVNTGFHKLIDKCYAQNSLSKIGTASNGEAFFQRRAA